MKPLFYVFGLISFLGVIIGAVLTAGASLGLFISLPCFLLVLLPMFVLLIPVYSIRGIGRNVGLAFNADGSVEELKKAIVFFKHMGLAFLLAGSLGVFVGVMTMLANLVDKSALGLSVSLSLMTFFYNLCLQLCVVLPMKAAVEKKLVKAV